MTISTASCFFTSPNLAFNSHPLSQSTSTSVKYTRARISAAHATAERTETATETEAIRSFRNARSSSPYDVLGVGIGADIVEVKAAYRRLARVLHPDVGSRYSSADDFMKVHLAYTMLSDPEKRADYDWNLFQRRVRGSSPVRAAGGFKSRRWETDQCW